MLKYDPSDESGFDKVVEKVDFTWEKIMSAAKSFWRTLAAHPVVVAGALILILIIGRFL